MFFYVDESGHTGPNLFDPSQPVLYYGVLSSKRDLDALAESHLSKLRSKLGVRRLHAAELGIGKLVEIADEINSLQQKMDLRFDLYQVFKLDHALISFFDQVFDQGMNPAITWTGYWTPLRYVLLMKVAHLFDLGTLRKAWSARLEINNAKAEAALIEVCRTIRDRVADLPDARSQQLISDTLQWAEKNPNKIRYNVRCKKDIAEITPNVIGFQTVMYGIGLRITEHKTEASAIVVDQQSQFNKAQRTLSEFYAKNKNVSLMNGPGLPEIDFSGMPTTPISFATGNNSAGLEIVDIYLWIFKRFIEQKDIPMELFPIIAFQANCGLMDEISIKGIGERWSKWFENLPEPTEEQTEKAKEMIAFDEARRLRKIREDAGTGEGQDRS
ncbi:MAG: DUF3800 domain-containing protein [Pseudomonadota bacterium]